MRKLPHTIFSGLLLVLFMSACSSGPPEVTTKFLTDLQKGLYDDAARLAFPQVQQQIAIIKQDKASLFNGQRWQYTGLKALVKKQFSTVTYVIRLNDGSQIWQQALLIQSTDGWKIQTIKNTKVQYSAKSLKARDYPTHGNQMLIAPLDILDVTKQLLDKHRGQFVMVSGYLCGFEEKGITAMLTMGNEDREPLLNVRLWGKAKDLAKTDHEKYMHIDSMVESPLGNTFTAIGLLKQANGRPFMEITNPQNIIIGQVLRLETR